MANARKVLALVEASSITGPAKNLLAFCRTAAGAELADRKGPGGLSVSLATFHRAGAPPSEFVAAAQDARITVHVLEERFRFDPQVLSSLRAVINSVSPDIIQTHSVKSHFLVRALGLRPWIAFHHGYTATDLKMLAYNQLDRWSLRTADAVVTVSEAFRSQVVHAGVPSGRVRVIPNAIAADAFQAARASQAECKKKLGLASDQRLVLSVGRLSREKGHATLLQAFARARQLRPDLNLRLIIVGDGPERKNLERTAETLAITTHLNLAGQVGDVHPYYRAADIFALPSQSEGSPNVLLEAMACCVPIVATAVGGIPEMVAHEETALLVRPSDPVAMANAISRLLDEKSLSTRLISKASFVISERYSPAGRFQRLIKLYDEIGGRPRPEGIGVQPGGPSHLNAATNK